MIAYGLESSLEKFHSGLNFEKKVLTILENIKSGNGKEFENGQLLLGQILGYDAYNSSAPSAPDPYWIVNDSFCIVFEDKIYEDPHKEIPTEHVTQAGRHHIWIRDNVEILKKDATILTVFVSNSNSITEDARAFCQEIYYCNRDDLLNWANKALNCLRTAKSSFVETGDSEWRENTHKIFIREQVTPLDFIELITQKKLSDI